MTRSFSSLCALTLPLALATACSDDAPEAEGSTETSGDGDGDPATGDGDGDPSGDGDGDPATGDGDGEGLEEPAPEVDWPTLDCDSLVPEYCMFPFPNNVFTTADADSNTGRRLALVSESMPSKFNAEIDTTHFNDADGFSPGLAMLTYLPGATTAGLPTWQNLDASLADDSPTVLINADTGERVAHFSEIDVSLDGATENALMIRPVTRLEDSTRYIVGIRNVVDGDGAPIPASAEFAALRDLLPTDDADVESRRPLYADIFARLGDAGVERESLQIAWDFTTASLDNNTANLVHMRDDALSMYGPDEGPTYTILSVDDQYQTDNVAFRVEGVFEVPLYLDDPDAGGRLVYGDDGLPEAQGTAEYQFWMMIPNSAVDTPAPLLQYGHGLLGKGTQVFSGNLRSFANEYNYVMFGVDWSGMAEDDALNIASMLVTGEVHNFQDVSDRLHQGVLNTLLATRMMKNMMADDLMFGSYIDPSEVYYLGISQGGIFGGTFMALTQDIERGCVGVPGQPYNLLLNRSVDFDEYFALLKDGFSDSRDLQIILALLQGLWDRTEPTGYSHKISEDLFPNTPVHEVLMRAAVGDHQVPTLGAHIMARAGGATHLDTGIREVWGLESVSDENAGNTYVEYDFGLPEDPLENIPQSACDDPHGKLRSLTEARDQLDAFFETGVVQNFCTDGVCSFPELSGC